MLFQFERLTESDLGLFQLVLLLLLPSLRVLLSTAEDVEPGAAVAEDPMGQPAVFDGFFADWGYAEFRVSWDGEISGAAGEAAWP